MLKDIFELQDTLNKRFEASQKDITSLGVQGQMEWTDKFMKVLIGECFEVQKACGSRWWKRDKDVLGVEHVKEELVDCLHFLVSGMLAMGMTATEAHEIYLSKNKNNHTRKDWKINE
jgi:dimeric dUTPase (all-alpha-NTP-PPase superfamily)